MFGVFKASGVMFHVIPVTVKASATIVMMRKPVKDILGRRGRAMDSLLDGFS